MTHHDDKILPEIKAEFARIQRIGPGKEAIRAFTRLAVRFYREKKETEDHGETNPVTEVGGTGAAL